MIHRAARLSGTALLLVGSVLVFFTFMRLSLPELGWIVFAPYLVFLHERGSRGRHVALLGTLVVAFVGTVSKMATNEIPWTPVPMFAIPMALSWFVAIGLSSAAHRRLGPRWGAYTFAALAATLGWAQYRFTPGSSWGALAHTQLDHLALVQLVSLTGLGGLTFLVALGSGLAAAAWSHGARAVRPDLLVFAALLAAALLYGQARLLRPAPGTPVLVGAVVSPVTHREFHAARANIDTLRGLDDELFARATTAVSRGARIVVWNEIATLVTPRTEGALAARGQAFARSHGVTLVMAYALVRSMDPFRDVNKYRLYLPDGTLADEYVKRHPVPGDPDEVGTRHAQVVHVEGIGVSGAICYDYGFPDIARDNARDGADLALVPSSDWRGIDPEHAPMAMMNAVAVGLPMVRPVRAATSLVTDAFGRDVGSLRADQRGDGVLVVAVPAGRARTLYARIGEVVPLLALAFLALVALRFLRSPASRPGPRNTP